MSSSIRLSAHPLRRVAPSALFRPHRRFQIVSSNTAVCPTQRHYAAHASSSSISTAAFLSVTPVDVPSQGSSHATLGAPPSPVEVHQVIARAVQCGRWGRALRLLLGAVHSCCVPLAETYQLVLLASLRGGGWQVVVELTERVATSPFSTKALYHTAADLLLSDVGQEAHGYGEELARTVVEELVPLMLADATRDVVWRQCHRESVLRVLAEAHKSQLVTQLYRRWSATAAYTCGEREAAMLMAAFAATGDWRSAEALRVRLQVVSDDVLVDYIRAFTAALMNSRATTTGGTARTFSESHTQLVPWEVALDVAARYKEKSALTAAAAELQHVAKLSTSPNDALRWWWAPETTVHDKLTELRRRSASSPADVSQLLIECHVTVAGIAELLGAVDKSGVLSTGDGVDGLSPYWTQWLDVVLALARYSPSALVSPSTGCADGFSRLLPNPLLRVPRLADPSLTSTPSLSFHVNKDNDLPLWQYVAMHMLSESPTGTIRDGDAARCLLLFTATLHYLLYAREAAASLNFHAGLLTAPTDIASAARDVCAEWVRQSRQLQKSCASTNPDGTVPGFIAECKDAVAVHLRTISTYTRAPSFQQCVDSVLCDATSTAAVVADVSILAYLKPLEQLARPTDLCDVMCAALTDAPSFSSTPHAAYLVTLYASNLLREGVAVVTLRPLLRRVEVMLHTVPQADTLLLLCAQLQWCWGNSLEGLRTVAAPILLRQQCWAVLSRLLACCPTPLSKQEQRAVVMCEEGQRLERLAELVRAQDVAGAWELWKSWSHRDGDVTAALSVPLPLYTTLVSLLVLHHRTREACEVLTVAPAGAEGTGISLSWPHRNLRVCRYVLRNPAVAVGLKDLWAVANVEGRGGNCELVRREATMSLAMHAAAALSFLHRDADAFRLLCDAEAFVVRYDVTHYHLPQAFGTAQEDAKGVDATVSHQSSPLILRRTDALLSESLPLFVQCAMPSILLSAMSQATSDSVVPSSSGHDNNDKVAEIMRITCRTFLFTTNAAEGVRAWSAVLPQFYSIASNFSDKEVKKSAEHVGADALMGVLSLVHRLLHRTVELRMDAPHAVLRLTVTAITTRAFPPDFRTTLIDGVSQALRERGEPVYSNSQRDAAVQVFASQVVQFLAAEGRHTQVLEWVNDFHLWNDTGDARMESDKLWQAIQASSSAAQRLSDTRVALLQRRTGAFIRKANTGLNEKSSTSECNSLQMLGALIECGAWQDAFSYYLDVVLEKPLSHFYAGGGAAPATITSDFANFSDAAMERVVLRDSFLVPSVLGRVLQALAEHAPWRTCVQGWMLLCTHLPLLPWSAVAPVVGPALAELLAAMQRQDARPHEIGTVFLWAVVQLDPPSSTVKSLLRQFSNAIAAAPEWTRADGELCDEQLRQLRYLLGERRVRAAAQAIVEAETALALATPRSLPPVPLGDFVSMSGEAWLLPGRPSLHASEVDALAALAPLLLLATTSQLEVLARRHLSGRFHGYQLKALLWLYRDELRQRVDAAQAADGDAALVDFLAHNTTLHVYASQAFVRGVANSATAAAQWLAAAVFDSLLPLHLAAQLWAACRAPAAALAACRWTPVVESELCEQILLRHGRPPSRLRTAPHLSRRAIAHYWSCFHHVLQPELHFGPLELCCLAAYAPVVAQLRTRHPNTEAVDYTCAMRELAGQVYRAHFCSSRVPVEDTLAHLRRPHGPAAIAAVMTTAFKKLKVLHAQIFDCSPAVAGDAVGHALPARLRYHFATCAAAVPPLEGIPDRLQQAPLAAATRRLGDALENKVVVAAPAKLSPATLSRRSEDVATQFPISIVNLLNEAQRRLPSLLLRSWVCWVLTECVVPRKPIPPAASLLLVEWVRAGLRGADAMAAAYDSTFCGGDVSRQWHSHAAAGQRTLQQLTCHELSCLWQLLSKADAWSLMSVGHRTAVEKMVCPTSAQVRGLPSKKRGDSGRHRKAVM